MKLLRRQFLELAATGAAALPTVSRIARAQTYPTRPVRLLVGFGPGTGVDIIGRLVADKLSEVLGKPVIVENVTGAAGHLANDRVAKAEPDGHTLVMAANSAIVMGPAMFEKPTKDLTPITQVYRCPNSMRYAFTTACVRTTFRNLSR
jgi:tripartite-type tricarboxylate transporter receptor subunit TctC